ncbi:MAG: hypothetical protein R3Y11_07020 [Pseudomonadota bacterium]
MENFFDIATPEEVSAAYEDFTAEELAFKRETLLASPDHNRERLAFLFADRGDFAEGCKNLDAIVDGFLRADVGRMLAHDIAYLDWCAHNTKQ